MDSGESKENHEIVDVGVASPDPQVLQTLLIAERARVLAYIKKHFPPDLSPLDEPLDVLHDTYFEAVRRIGSFKPTDETSIFRLLVTIARRRIAQLLRLRGRVKHGGRSRRIVQTDSIVTMLSELAVHQQTPSRSAVRNEFLSALATSLERLPNDVRTAVTLRHIDGLSPKEIAQRMDRTERAVHQLCYRGVQMVRRELRSASMFL
jgi:RNA polymerase sigma-70 factor (ECF subfamily)